MKQIERIIEEMINRHEEMRYKYFVGPHLFRTENREEYVKNRNTEVEFRITSDDFNGDIIKIKQTCWIDENKAVVYFKTKYYINGKLEKKNINFLKDIFEDICLDPDVKIEYPVAAKEETKKPAQMSLFDMI